MTAPLIAISSTESPVPPTLPSPARYMPGLDVVRGAAITMVLIYHRMAAFAIYKQASLSPLQFNILHLSAYGSLGVHLFFVLSGVLITGILLDTRHNANYYKPFYMRRILRILPAYLLMIVVLKLSHQISSKFVAVCLLYLVNMSSLFHARPEYSGFWSLSVEEQFYLIWPVLVRKLTTRKLFVLSALIVVCTPLLRFALLHGPILVRDISYKVWDVGDFFASGALLAMLIRSPRFQPALPRIALSCCVLAALLIASASFLPKASSLNGIYLQLSFRLFPWVFAFTGIVLLAYLKPGVAAHPLAKPMLFMGKISYGLYIVHPLVFDFFTSHWNVESTSARGMPLVGSMLARFAAESSVAILIAFVSRTTFEEFFLRLKPRQHKVVENLAVA